MDIKRLGVDPLRPRPVRGIYIALPWLIIGGVVIGFIFLLQNPAVTQGKLTITGGDAPGLTLDISKDFESVSILLERVFEDEKGEIEARAFLERKYHIYDICQTRFVNEVLCSLDCDHPVARAILLLKRTGQGPFADKLRRVKISFPQFAQDDQEHGISSGAAAVLRNSVFADASIQLWNRNKDNYIEVVAQCRHSRVLDCLDENGDTLELIQIRTDAGKELFGRTPLESMEDGYAITKYSP